MGFGSRFGITTVRSRTKKAFVFRSFASGEGSVCVPYSFDHSLLLSITKLLYERSRLPFLDRDLVDIKFLHQQRANCVELDAAQTDLDQTLADAGILLDDVLLLTSDEMALNSSLADLRKFLYGSSSVPVLQRDLAMRPCLLDATGTSVRRQLLIERLASSQAIIEYRLFAESMVQRGLLGSVMDMRLVWSDWLASVSARIRSNVSDPSDRGSQLLKSVALSSEKLSVILCVTALSELCSPPRSSHRDEEAQFSAEMRKWTNADIVHESSEQQNSSYGRTSFVSLCDAVASAVLFEARLGPWCPSDKISLGSELVGILLSECYVSAPAPPVPPIEHSGPIGVDLGEELIRTNLALAEHISRHNAEEDILVHAFAHSIETRGFRSTGFVTLRPELLERLKSVVPSLGFMKLPPMVVAPASWSGFWGSGYLTRRSPLVRFTGTKDPSRDGNFVEFFSVRKAMDYLGSTPWRVNPEILDLVELARSGVPGIPTRPEKVTEEKITERTTLLQKLREKRKLNAQVPILMSKLNPARDFKNSDFLYFPHSVDFRGRAYPISAPFNHQGDDICRGLLKFAQSKPLGPQGWYWLQVHVANLFGQDKKTLLERIDWVAANQEALRRVAKEPLKNVEWVAARTDDFWQALAATLEFAAALNHPTGAESFASALPIQQDGSCNGLQHYAALGKDAVGARAVNIVPSEKVEDVYSVVLEIVKQKVAKDAKKKTSSADSSWSFEAIKNQPGELAQLALKFEDTVLQRKIVKQTVMTICYGVTRMGASDQINSQLSELPIGKLLTPTQLAVLASYLARLTLSSIDEVFADAMNIKRWFDAVAKEVNKHKMSINWITPAGLPCRQPYKKISVTEIKTRLQKVKIVNTVNNDAAPVSGPKQRMGFPPNFIHSLDASHMILTALECQKQGITFAAVHDSYWTHACDVPIMNEAIRKQFLQMYSQPILEQLRDSLVMQLGADGYKIPPLPKQGMLDLKCVLQSPYFFD